MTLTRVYLKRRVTLSVLAGSVVIAVLGLLPQALSRTLPDIAFPLWAADRMLHGARLYVDILEINPPLFIWLDLPLAWLSQVTGVGSITWYRIATSLLLVASLAGCWWALERGLDDEHPPFRRLLWLTAAFVLLLLPQLDWGEREHLSLALTLPYILLGIARARGRTVSRRGAVLAGIAAGIGIAFKPHFVLVWFGRELACRWRPNVSQGSRSGSRHLTFDGRLLVPETVAVPLVGVAYLLSVIAIHPAYFHLLRDLGGAYQHFLRNSALITLFLGEGSAIVLAALILAVALRRIPKHAVVWQVLVGSMLGYFLAAVLQAKGWRYQFYPALGLSMLVFTAIALDAWQPVESRLMRVFAAIPSAALATAVLGTALLAGQQIVQPLNSRYAPDPSISRLIPLVKGRATGQAVFVISPNMASGFPLTNYAGTVWPSRLSNMWPAVVAYDSAIKGSDPVQFREPDAMGPVERFGLETTVQDFLGSRPALVISLIAVDQPGWGMQRLDLLRWLRLDPGFSAAWLAYDSLGRVGNYTVWARRGTASDSPLPPNAAPVPQDTPPPSDVAIDSASLLAMAAFLVFVVVFYRMLHTTSI